MLTNRSRQIKPFVLILLNCAWVDSLYYHRLYCTIPAVPLYSSIYSVLVHSFLGRIPAEPTEHFPPFMTRRPTPGGSLPLGLLPRWPSWMPRPEREAATHRLGGFQLRRNRGNTRSARVSAAWGQRSQGKLELRETELGRYACIVWRVMQVEWTQILIKWIRITLCVSNFKTEMN
jgi:hypothetical protein